MIGYIFETTNKNTGETFLGKRYAVSFDKNFFGEEAEKSVEKYGKSAFAVKMIMPYDNIEALDKAFDAMKASRKPAKKEAPVVEEEKEEKPRKKHTKAVEEE
jgi:hypothetical protein